MRTTFRLIFVLPLAALTLDMAMAHESATGPVGARMRAMTEMGKSLKILHQAAKSRQLMGNEEMKEHIKLLRENADAIPELFEEEATMPISDALPVIWSEPEKFNAAADEFAALVENLLQAHAQRIRPEAIKALGDVMRGCGGCHDAFRE